MKTIIKLYFILHHLKHIVMNEDTNSGGKGVARSAITGDNDNNSITKNQNVGEE